MLDIRNAYLDFGKQLQPPPDFEIDYAVATTYSLDLYALLSIPLAMYYKQSLDSEVSVDNFQILEAIQNLHKHLKIYSHMGKISVPKASAVSLLAFVEKCVVQVMPDSKKASFHPKVWVLRFKSIHDKTICYRVIVMSRNLTFDKSYDIAYWMDGYTKTSARPTNTDLIKLLKNLNDHSPIQHKSFVEDLAKVEFELCDNFKNSFFTYFPTKDWESAMGLDSVYKKRLILSPFLTDGTINRFIKKTRNKLIVFSRKNEFDKLPHSTIAAIEPYCFEQEIVDHHLYENTDDEDGYAGGNGDAAVSEQWNNNLHAKLYLHENKNETQWALGSANLTNSAFTDNSEFMLHLKGIGEATNIESIKAELTKKHNGVVVFKKYERDSNAAVAEPEPNFRDLEYRLLYQINHPEYFAARIENTDKHYACILKLKVPDGFEDLKIKANPFGVVKSLEILDNQEVRFENIPLHKLSSFVSWEVFKGNTLLFSLVTKVEVENMPDNRLGNILKSIINNPTKFMALLMSLLTDEPVVAPLLKDEKERNSLLSGQGLSAIASMPVYEELLLSLSRRPKHLYRLALIIEKLSDLGEESIIPDEFLVLWNNVKQLLPDEE